MQKEKIVNAINKYFLNGTTNSVKVIIKDKTLSCAFISDTQSVIGEVIVTDVEIEDCEVAIFTTSELLKLLSVLDDNIDIKINKVDTQAISLNVSDATTTILYMFANLSTIKVAPKPKQMPNFNVEVEITKDFSDKFLKAKNAMPNAENFAVTSNGVETEFILNYSTISTNRVRFGAPSIKTEQMQPVCFSASGLKEILTANKNAEIGKIEVSSSGLSRVSFSGSDYKAVYYLVQLSIQ